MSAHWEPKAGLLVNARSFGRAVVARVTRTGILVRLPDFGDLEVELDSDDVAPLNEDGGPEKLAGLSNVTLSATVPRATAFPEPDLPKGEAEARKSIEALRFGLVPSRGIETLTLGFDALETWVLGRLPCAHGGGPQVSAITGPFGTGKSHTMAVIRHLARREGYVTAKAEVDGQMISLSSPPQLLHKLWATTEAAGFHSATPLLDLYLKAIESGRSSPSVAPRGIDRIKHNYEVVLTLKRAGQIDKHSDLLEAVLSSSGEVTVAEATRSLKAEPNVFFNHYAPKPMIGKRLADQPYDFVEVLAGHAVVAKLAGYKGLILTIDEFEVERALLSRTKYERVTDLLDVLTRYLRNDLEYEPAPLGLFFATVGDDQHEGDAAIWEMLGENKHGYYHLQTWSPNQRCDLASRLHRLYCAAYGLQRRFDGAIVERIEEQLELSGYDDSGLIRAFIKRYIGTLDALYGPPST